MNCQKTFSGSTGEVRIAFLVALACVLQIAESLLPNPIPGLRLGLANMVTLTAILHIGLRAALEISLLRTVLSSLILGTFLSPTFLLSFTAAIVSTLLMGMMVQLALKFPRSGISIFGISIIGAFSHNLTQLSLAWFLLIQHPGIFLLLPWLALAALGSGWLTGLITVAISRRIRDLAQIEKGTPVTPDPQTTIPPGDYKNAKGLLHLLPVVPKLILLILAIISTLLIRQLEILLALPLLCLLLSPLLGVSPRTLLRKAGRYLPMLAMVFFLPLLFQSGPATTIQLGTQTLQIAGLIPGLTMAGRLLFLIMLSTLLVGTTPPLDLARGFSLFFRPFRLFGFQEARMGAILSLAWEKLPAFSTRIREEFKRFGWRKSVNPRELSSFLGDLIARYYLEAAQEDEPESE